MRAPIDVGVFGSSGLYTFLDDVEHHEVATPWGPPSAPIAVGTSAGVRVGFLPRHGVDHQWPPHGVNYRANVDAMRQLGATALLAPFAAGSLQSHIHPGDFVVVDQLVDRTSGRADTFHDSFENGPQHASFADPYDDGLRRALIDASRSAALTVHENGTVVVINGPRFSTRAESAYYQSLGWDVINMTQQPEAVLAREAGIPYGAIAVVTDYDAGLATDPEVRPVSQEEVFAVFEQNVGRLRHVLVDAISRIAGAGDLAPSAGP